MAPRKGRKGRKGAAGKPAIKPSRRRRTAKKAADKPPPRPAQPPTGWMNAGDDPTYRIIQEIENRKRKFTAAHSSGAAAPPLPLANDPRRLHEEILKRAAAVEETIAKLPTIGHNRPPEPIEPAPLNDNEIEEIKNEITIVKAQPAVPTQRPAEAVEAESKLRQFGEKVLEWIANQAVTERREGIPTRTQRQ